MLLQQVPEEPTRLLVLPYFAPGGTPYFDMDTPGVIYGLRLSTSRGEVLRPLLEGVLLEMRGQYRDSCPSGVIIRDFRADRRRCPQCPVESTEGRYPGRADHDGFHHEAGCCGAALLAAAARLGVPVERLAEEWVHPRAVFEPDPRGTPATGTVPATSGFTRRSAL